MATVSGTDSPVFGRESVWDYPRPPRVEECRKRLTVVFNGQVIADTRRARRVLETSQPPAYYFPLGDVRVRQFLMSSGRTTLCEWKGAARYYTIVVGDQRAEHAAWCYPQPTPGYEAIKDHVAFYPARMDGCYVEGERARAQDGDFYGGWITDDVIGPFKGAPGTLGW